MWNFLSKNSGPEQKEVDPEDSSERESTIEALDDLDAVLTRASKIGARKSTSTQEFHISDIRRLDEEKEEEESRSDHSLSDITAVG